MNDLFDITERKHGGNAESVAAQKKRQTTGRTQRADVMAAVKSAGAHGLTLYELAARLGVSPNTISGRFSELKANRMIKKIGVRKNENGNNSAIYHPIK